MKPYLHSLFCVSIALFLYSCTDNSASPIRNARFDPELLNKSALTISPTFADYEFTKEHTKMPLGSVYTKQILAVFSTSLSAAQQQELLNSYGFVKALGVPVQSGSDMMHTLELIDGLNPVQVQQAIALLQENPAITYAAPFFRAGTGTQLKGIGNQLTVHLNSKDQLQQLELLLAQSNAAVVKSINENTFLVKVDKNSKGNALELANLLNAQNGFAKAETNFLTASL